MNGSLLGFRSLKISSIAALVLVLVCSAAAQAQLIPYNPRVERGATVGGVAGAIIGGVIGHQNDETPEGAIIGGAVGAVTGGIIGHAQNQREAEMRAAQQRTYQASSRPHPNYYQQRQQHTYYQNRPVRQPVGVAEIVAMTRRGFPDRLIIQHIQLNGVRSAPTTEELMRMYDDGVSTEVIDAMQQYSAAQEGTVVGSAPASAPVLLSPAPTAMRSQPQPQSRTYRRRY